MKYRTRIRRLELKAPITVSRRAEPLLPGLYTVETRERCVSGLTFITYQQPRLTLNWSGMTGETQQVVLDPDELERVWRSGIEHDLSTARAMIAEFRDRRSRRQDRAAIDRADNEGMLRQP